MVISKIRNFECPACHKVWAVYWWVPSHTILGAPFVHQVCPFCGEVVMTNEPDSETEAS